MKSLATTSPRLGAALVFIATLAVGAIVGLYTLRAPEPLSLSPHAHAAAWSKTVLILIAAYLMAAVAHSILRQPMRLRREVEERTAELQASNAALARSSSLLHSASINGRVFPWEWDVQNDTLHWGVPPDQILGPYTSSRPTQPDFRDMVHPEDLERYLETGRRTLQQGCPYYCEFRLVGADNLVRWIAARGEPVRDASDRIVRMLGTSIDITERKLAEEGLRQFSRAAEQINQGIMITDARGNIEYVNPHFCMNTGYRRDEVIGRDPRFLSSGQTAPEVFRHMWATLLAGDTWRGEIVNRRKDGSVFWESEVISPVRNDAGEITHFVAVKEDISARKEAEDEVRQLAEELAEKNRELEGFSYTLSHDLRAPLRAVDGFVTLALENPENRLAPEARDFLERAKSGATRMGRLIEDMLELARLSRREIRRKPVSLSQIAGEIVEELRQIEPARQVEVVIQDGLADKADPVLMRNVLQNLLGNAWKFTRRTTGACIELGRIESDDVPRYFVRDNGAGFDMRFADKLFTPFQRLHSQSEFDGTGVGLASVDRILKRHGGRIWARGAPGQGATFEFTLE